MSKADLVGQRFGMLRVTEKTEEKEQGYSVWRCICDCEGVILVNTKRLTRGTTANCGCIPKRTAQRGPIAEDLTDRCFGSLTVLYQAESKSKRARWMCKCKCGTEKCIAARDLKSGNTKSCGCEKYRKGKHGIDLHNRRFGRLAAMYPTDRRDSKSSIYWHCVCDCGNETEVTADRLLYGGYRSCGCLKKENQQAIFRKLNMIDGTCVEWIEKRKERSDNTSGFRGVYKMKNGRYRVRIGFKRKRFHVGAYNTYEEAVNARLEAEKLIHEGFLHNYYQWKEKAEGDPEWGVQHPFRFEVNKSANGFSIIKD